MVDATTQAALEGTILNWRVLIYADFDGDVLRATSGLYDKVISGSGDAELDGIYDSYNHNVITVGPVTHNETGSDIVAISMNGLVVNTAYIVDRFDAPILDRYGDYISGRTSSFLNIIGDKTRWQGRAARLWFYCVDQDENQVGSIIPYYTGYMNDVVISGSPEMQKVTLTIENYLASLAGAFNQTYMMQNLFDAGDLSANASLSAANGIVEATYGGQFGGDFYIDYSGGVYA